MLKSTIVGTARNLLLLSLCAGSTLAVAQSSQDMEMISLAQKSGCVTCHSIATGGTGPDGLKPIGPPWQKVAEKYKGQASALADLTQTVLKGSSPYQSHWKGEVSGVAMPPNSVVLTADQAQDLVGWILHLAD